MDVGKTILIVYFCISAVIAARYAIFIAQKLDKYDWLHEKSDIWFNYFMAVIIWPIAASFLPKYFLNPGEIIKSHGKYSIADQHRSFDDFWDSPVMCSSLLRYCPHHTEGEGIFTFPTEDVLALFQDESWRQSIRYEGHYDQILNWLRNFDRRNSELTEIPEPWESFHGVAGALLARQVGSVFCKHCNLDYGANELITIDDSGKPGWNLRHLVCINHHELFASDLYHILPASVLSNRRR